MSAQRRARPGDMLARMRGAVAAGSESPAPVEPTSAPRRRRPARQEAEPAAAPATRPRSRQARADGPPELAGFEVRGAGGKRTVLYLPADVLDHLAAIQSAAAAQGGRLDRSAIVAQLVRRHRDLPR